MLFPCTIKEQIRRVIERRKTSRSVGNTDYILREIDVVREDVNFYEENC